MPVRLDAAQLDRAAGVLVGCALGDALGAGYEFGLPAPEQPVMLGGGLGDWEPGEWTDDTQMSLCLAEETARGTVDSEAVAARFLSWFREGQKDVGIQTASVLSGARYAHDVARSAAVHFTANPSGSAGNGSLMRTGPVALHRLGSPALVADAAMAISALTHGDPLCGEACAIWSVAIEQAVRTGTFDGVRQGLAVLPPTRAAWWSARLDEAETRPPTSFRPNGYVVTALQAAWAVIAQTPVPADQPCRHLQQAVVAAVRIGDDTDTVAAIAGALLGARWGASAVPLGWRTLLHGWPGYQVADLVRLAVLAARGGSPDSSGWPTAPSLQPYYAARFAPPARAVPLAEDAGVVVGDVAALQTLTEDTDAVVSLCRVGRQDVPSDLQHVELWLMDSADPSDNPNLDFMLADLAKHMVAWRSQGRRVFLHCVQAESRTPTAAAAYLAARFDLPGREALASVRSVLPESHPNATFVSALERLWPGKGEVVPRVTEG